MLLERMTWPEVEALDRDVVVVIPAGSLEQHGPHLPLFTDTLISTAAARQASERAPDKSLVTPGIWLGCSAHHLAFAGTCSATFESYETALRATLDSLHGAGFQRFYIVNGHGGNSEPNGICCRQFKQDNPEVVIGHAGWFSYVPESVMAEVMEGPVKTIKHACEAEASVMMHLHPDLVRTDKLRDDGLAAEPPVPGLVWGFDELTAEGAWGHATLATAEKGKRLFESAVDGLAEALVSLHAGVCLAEPQAE